MNEAPPGFGGACRIRLQTADQAMNTCFACVLSKSIRRNLGSVGHLP